MGKFIAVRGRGQKYFSIPKNYLLIIKTLPNHTQGQLVKVLCINRIRSSMYLYLLASLQREDSAKGKRTMLDAKGKRTMLDTEQVQEFMSLQSNNKNGRANYAPKQEILYHSTCTNV